MPPPGDARLPLHVQLTENSQKGLIVSDALLNLLAVSRTSYDWPEGTGPAKSQQTILDLEAQAEIWLTQVDAPGAHALVQEVSIWGGNNAKAQNAIDSASAETRAQMLIAIQNLMTETTLAAGLDHLSGLPGVQLVMATKVYRFCCPAVGAALDRHTSYFFNSLDVVAPDGTRRKATAFRREWGSGKHDTSRLAIYYPGGYRWNRDQYLTRYLPLLSEIVKSLNCMGVMYRCAATGSSKPWRPADVEMAAYCWWARNGPR